MKLQAAGVIPLPEKRSGLMRILVVSDSHRNVDMLRKILLVQPQAEIVIHLGDGEDDLALLKPGFPEKMFLQVRGNCDWGSNLPYSNVYTAEGVKIFYTHGHLYNVKGGLYSAVCAAREQKAQVLLFGHTHQALTDYEDGLYIMNPGSAGYGAPSYGTLDITPQGIVTNIVKPG